MLMRRRYLEIDAQLVVDCFLKGNQPAVRVTKNGLPKDVRVVDGVIYGISSIENEPPFTVRLYLESAEWKDSDPARLEDVWLESIYMEKFKPKSPEELMKDAEDRFQAKIAMEQFADMAEHVDPAELKIFADELEGKPVKFREWT
jgi:hypothetical protein